MNRFEFLKKIKLPKLNRPSVGGIIFWAVILALAAGAFIFARGFTACWQLTNLPGISPSTCVNGSNNPLGGFQPSGTPTPIAGLPPTPAAVAPAVDLPPAWDGASRINILFLGLDYRDYIANEGPPRTDSMILFTVDPISKTAGMLSIPRDMWVNIPGFGYSRINTAYPSGEGAQLPGGGPALAMKTVEQFIGVPVQYFVIVDFYTFVQIADMFQCITVAGVTEPLTLDPMGPGLDHVVITPGGARQLCGGWKILAYARTRHSENGDMDRAARQQQVIFALRDKIFDPKVFPGLVAQAPEIYARLQSGIHTNMSFEDAVKLAVLMKDIPRSSIKTGVIDTSMVTLDSTTLAGQPASIMKPIADKIRVLRDEIFTTTGPTSPIAQGDPVALMQAEEARVRVVDGTFTPGLDQRAGKFFQSLGMNVTEVGAAPEAHSTTLIIIYGPKLYTLRYLVSTFGISSSQIRFNPDPASTVDIEIRLGSDLASIVPQ